MTPSGAALPCTFWTRQGNEKKWIPCGRPRANDATISPMLLHRIFGEFVDDCDTINYTPADYCFASDLADVMSALYENEAARRAAVGDKFRQYGIHFNRSKVRNMKYEADADLSTKGNYYVIAEFKNEVASSSAEPYFQALLYYLDQYCYCMDTGKKRDEVHLVAAWSRKSSKYWRHLNKEGAEI